MDRAARRDRIALNLLPGFGPVLARRALDACESAREVVHLPHDELRGLGLSDQAAAAVARARRDLERQVEREFAEAARLGVRILVDGDPDYPAAIAALEDAPVVLYVRGSIPEGVARIAIVGSRRATAYGRRVATQLAAELSARGAEIVSGGARGIDTSAHQGALEAGGRTVAVLGCGLSVAYPSENAALFDRMASAGALISEFPLETAPLPENFPRRNRLISALSAAVVVVEAAARSGSSITAGHALEQGREVMAVPGPIHSEASEGCHRLIQQGAKLVRCAEDVLEELSPMYKEALRPERRETLGGGRASEGRSAQAPVPDLSPDEVAVTGLLDDPEPVHIDRLAEVAPFGVARLQAALFGLVLRGAVDQLPGGYYLPRFPSPGRTEGR